MSVHTWLFVALFVGHPTTLLRKCWERKATVTRWTFGQLDALCKQLVTDYNANEILVWINIHVHHRPFPYSMALWEKGVENNHNYVHVCIFSICIMFMLDPCD